MNGLKSLRRLALTLLIVAAVFTLISGCDENGGIIIEINEFGRFFNGTADVDSSNLLNIEIIIDNRIKNAYKTTFLYNDKAVYLIIV